MAKATIDPVTGEVVLRCSVDEAMAVEVTLATQHTSTLDVDGYTHAVWDTLDDLRRGLMLENPGSIDLDIRVFRRSELGE